jgi:hypothetical protein
LLNSEALSSPNFEDLEEHPFIVGIDWSARAIGATLSQIQKCANGEFRKRLLFAIGRKCGAAAANYSSHRGECAGLVWALNTWSHLLKYYPFIVLTDSMSVRYLQNIKSQNGVFARWYETLGNFSFTVTHSKVVVEDAISRCPDACREPTQEELDWENHHERDPVGDEPNLELLAKARREGPGYGVDDREEEICDMSRETNNCLEAMYYIPQRVPLMEERYPWSNRIEQERDELQFMAEVEEEYRNKQYPNREEDEAESEDELWYNLDREDPEYSHAKVLPDDEEQLNHLRSSYDDGNDSDEDEEEDRLPTPPPINRFHTDVEETIEVEMGEPQVEEEAEEARVAIAADHLNEEVLPTAEERAQVEDEGPEPDPINRPDSPTLEEADKERAIRSLGLGEPDAQLIAADENGPGNVGPQIGLYLRDQAARLTEQAKDPDLRKLKLWLHRRELPAAALINYQTANLQLYRKLFGDFTLSPVDGPLEEQLIYRKGSTNKMIPPRLVIPYHLQKMLIEDTHL